MDYKTKTIRTVDASELVRHIADPLTPAWVHDGPLTIDEARAEFDRRFPVQPAQQKRDVPCAECNATYGHWDHCTKSSVSDEDRELARRKRKPAPVSGWQPIESAPDSVHVLVFHDGKVKIAEFRDGRWWARYPDNCYSRRNGPTMWMPLPDVPR